MKYIFTLLSLLLVFTNITPMQKAAETVSKAPLPVKSNWGPTLNVEAASSTAELLTYITDKITKTIENIISQKSDGPTLAQTLNNFIPVFQELAKKAEGPTAPEALKTIGDAIMELSKKGEGPNMPQAIDSIGKALFELAKKPDGATFPEALVKTAQALEKLAEKPNGPTVSESIVRLAQSIESIAKNDGKPTLPEAMIHFSDTLKEGKANLITTHIFGIDSKTIKTGLIAGTGFLLAAAGIMIIYKEFTKETLTIEPEQKKSQTFGQKALNFLKSRYLWGSLETLAGLSLIIKSDALANAW